jgi:hypothetical protein
MPAPPSAASNWREARPITGRARRDDAASPEGVLAEAALGDIIDVSAVVPAVAVARASGGGRGGRSRLGLAGDGLGGEDGPAPEDAFASSGASDPGFAPRLPPFFPPAGVSCALAVDAPLAGAPPLDEALPFADAFAPFAAAPLDLPPAPCPPGPLSPFEEEPGSGLALVLLAAPPAALAFLESRLAARIVGGG